MNMQNQSLTDYQRVEQAIRYLERHQRRQPSLDEVAASVHLSKYHFQRLFKRWAGVSPTQFLHYLTVEYAKTRLQAAGNVLETALEAGLSGPSRLHDLFVNFEAMTPGEYKRLGAGLDIAFGLHDSPFGPCLLAKTERGICALRFVDGELEETLAQLRAEWPLARFVERPEATGALAARVFGLAETAPPRPLPLLVKGTNFQVQVWRALLSVPAGNLATYQDVARRIERPGAARAVAAAIGRNPIAYLIPCHRVIASTGQAHGYRWGATRKRAILAWEAGRFAGEGA